MADVTNSSVGDAWTDPADVTATPDADNIAWRWGEQQGPGDIIQANRILTVKVFVLLIAMLPLVLFGGLLILLRQLMADPNRERFPVELLVGVGVFLLAIIPIRAVLVPSDITQTTMVDYILGTEMAVIISSSLMIVLAGSVKPRKVDAIKPETVALQVETPTVAADVAVDEEQIERRVAGVLFISLAGIVAVRKIGQLLRKARKRD